MIDDYAQQWDPEQYDRHVRFVSELGMPVVELLAPQPGEHILDLGCGDGALTRHLQEFGCSVTGVDASPEMVAAAQKLGLDVRVMSGEALVFRNEFDAVFTNAALHWMKDQPAVLRGVSAALKPGGRFVGEFGGAGNVARIVRAIEGQLRQRGLPAENPWFFPTPEAYAAMLENHGFTVRTIDLIPRPTPLPGALAGWLETFAQSFTAALPAGEKDAFFRDVADELRPELCDGEGRWTADYVRLRFAAVIR